MPPQKSLPTVNITACGEQRNLVERFFNRIKHFRGIATRYHKCPENYLAAVKLVCVAVI